MKAQSGVEYLIIIGFVTLAITLTLIAAYFYIGMSRDRIRVNQIEVLANKIVNSAESVFYAGQPSKSTISVYVPKGVKSIEMQGYDLVITLSTSTGTIKRAFSSRVYLDGSINSGEGVRSVTLTAQADKVSIS